MPCFSYFVILTFKFLLCNSYYSLLTSLSTGFLGAGFVSTGFHIRSYISSFLFPFFVSSSLPICLFSSLFLSFFPLLSRICLSACLPTLQAYINIHVYKRENNQGTLAIQQLTNNDQETVNKKSEIRTWVASERGLFSVLVEYLIFYVSFFFYLPCSVLLCPAYYTLFLFILALLFLSSPSFWDVRLLCCRLVSSFLLCPLSPLCPLPSCIFFPLLPSFSLIPSFLL